MGKWEGKLSQMLQISSRVMDVSSSVGVYMELSSDSHVSTLSFLQLGHQGPVGI